MEDDRIVVVTGGAGGIGSKIVDRFLANGDTIFALDNRSDALMIRGIHQDHGVAFHLGETVKSITGTTRNCKFQE